MSADRRVSGGASGRAHDRLVLLVWLLAALALLIFPLASWLRIAAGYRFFVPGTPLDHTRPDMAAEFDFLWNCRRLVPPGATFTVLGPARDPEMALFMVSLGVLPDRVALPSSYYGVVSEEGARADYVLAFGCGAADRATLAFVARVRGGCVYRRRPAR